MKQVIRLTESDLMKIIKNSVRKALKEDVLGNDWNVNDDIRNNYEVFDDPFEDMDDQSNEHDWGVQGEENFDPTEYDPEAYMEDPYEPSDNYLNGVF